MSDELKRIGAQMASTMFNLAQRAGEMIDSDLAAKFDKMRKEWDAAVRATPPSPSTAPIAEDELPPLPSEQRAGLAAALNKIIEMNRQHAFDQFGDADKAERWACVRVAREALAGERQANKRQNMNGKDMSNEPY